MALYQVEGFHTVLSLRVGGDHLCLDHLHDRVDQLLVLHGDVFCLIRLITFILTLQLVNDDSEIVRLLVNNFMLQTFLTS